MQSTQAHARQTTHNGAAAAVEPRSVWAAVGAVLAAIAASACCIGPLVVAVLGIGSVTAWAALEPYRPVFGGVTLVLLGLGFWWAYRPTGAAQCTTDAAGCATCATPRVRRSGRIVLWIAAVLAAAAWTFPEWSSVLAG